jgi:NADH dehydrogenase
MVRTDNHKLVNLSLGRKIASSAALLGGLLLFYAAVFLSVFVTNWEFSFGEALQWGRMLITLRERAPAMFFALFAAHAGSLGLILATSNGLFQKTAMPRGARIALMGAAVGLGGLDLLCWLLLSSAPTLRHVLGVLIALESVGLLYIVGRPLHEMWGYTRWRPREETPNSTKQPVRVVIVGGGFSGLDAALGLDRALGYHKDLEITLIDKRNYFLFPPLLPSVAAGAIETRQVTYPFRRIFEATNIRFKKELVETIDPVARVVRARVDVDADPATGKLRVLTSETPYDYLVLAPGSDTNTFRTKGVIEHAFFMRELGDAVAVRNHLIDCFEHAAREPSSARRKELLSIVICGAGPTGVELASEVRDLIHHVLLRRYPEIDAREIHISLVQSGEQILPGWHASIVKQASGQLHHLQVNLRLGRRVVAVDPFAVTLDNGETIAARTCVWCAGVKPAAMLEACAFPKDKSGRVLVDPDLRVQGFPDVFVLGDAAYLVQNGRPLPPLGQVAFQQGSQTAKNLVRLLKGQPTKPFKYFNFGALVSVGEHFAAIELLGVRMAGFFAWIIWRSLYLMKLVGFGNKVRVVLDWTLDLLVERSFAQISASRQDLHKERAAAEEKQDAAAKVA